MNWIVSGSLPTGLRPVIQTMLMLVLFPVQANSQDEELAMIQGLRERRLFDLSIKQVELANLGLAQEDFHKKILLEIELLKTKMAKAFEKDPKSRFDSVQTILHGADKFILENVGNPNIVLVEVQKGMIRMRFGELLRKEIEAGATTGGRTRIAFQTLRDADRQFEKIDKELSELIPTREKKPKDHSLSQLQMISLQNQVRYQKIKSMVNRGLLYGESDPENKIAVLTTSKSDLEKLIPLIEKVDQAWWDSRLDLLSCLRILGEFSSADLHFKSYPVQEAIPAVKLAFKAERLRLAIAQNQLEKAESLISSGRQIAGVVSADFDFSILEYYLHKLHTEDQGEPTRVRNSAIKIVKSIETLHGTYWGRRANLALISSAKMAGTGGSETLIRVAQEHYRKKNHEQAILEFENAANAAREELNRSLEMELRFQAITIHRSLNQHELVVKKSSLVSRQFKETKRSAVIHLFGILSGAQLVREQKLEPLQYVKLLDFHLDQWGNHPTIGKVAQFRGEYDFATGNLAEAAFQFQRSILAIAKGPALTDLRLLKKSCMRLTACFESLAVDEARKLQAFAESFGGKSFFDATSEPFNKVEPWLGCFASYALEIEPAVRPEVMAQMANLSDPGFPSQRMMIRLAATAGNRDLVRGWVKNWNLAMLQEGSDQEAVALLTGLQRDWKRQKVKPRIAIATAVTQLNLADNVKTKFAVLIGESLVQLNQPGKARTVLAAAVAVNPKSKKFQLALAKLLAGSVDEAEVQKGLGIWRKVLAQSPGRSDEWFEAKYHIAFSYAKLGQGQRAKTILELMKAVPPGWEQSRFSDQFGKLLNSVSNPNR